MKFLASLLLLICCCYFVDSAQVKRGEKNNLSVMLAYKPNTEIRTRDLDNDKTWTYLMNNDDDQYKINEKLLETLIKERFAERSNDIDDRKTVKRENPLQHDDESDDSHSHSHEDIEPASIVQVAQESDKKTCYKNTYKNVLSAFEEALKSQIESYKKCVCQNKKPTTTTTTTTTTSAPTIPDNSNFERFDNEDEEEDEHHDEKRFKISIDNENAIAKALDHKDDIICFHRQYAFMLNNLLDRIPCGSKKVKIEENHSNDPVKMKQLQGPAVKRAERHNNYIEEYRDLEDESESVEMNISDVTRKPKSKGNKSMKSEKKTDDQDKLNDQILAILKQHLEAKNETPKNIIQEQAPKKITIKQKQVEIPQEDSEEISSEQKMFMQQLQELFNKYQVASEETFPLQSGEHSTKSTTSMPIRKSFKKPQQHKVPAVTENSDESTEIAFNTKNRKIEKEHHEAKQSPRKSSLDYITKKSYRTAARGNSVESDQVIATKKHRGSARTSVDDRLTADLAKKLSAFARSKAIKE